MLKFASVLMSAATFLLSCGSAPAGDSPGAEKGKRAPEKRREVKWNNPDGRRLPGVEHGSFHSASMDVDVGYNVALPAGYAQGDRRFPVIYFLHGAGGNENSDVAGFSGMLAKYVAEKKLAPAICVFPNGGMSGYQDRPAEKVMGETLIIKELIPLIDQKYRTQAKREGRALAGFSMGGGGAVRLAMKHPDMFSAAASWAGAFGMRGGIPSELQPENLEKVAGRVRLLLIVGDKDMTYARHEPVIKNLQQAKYPHRYRVLEGIGHNLGAYHEKTAEEVVVFLMSDFRGE